MSLTVDVLIPTYRPDKKLNVLLERLAAQTYPIQRIIVMNTDEALYPAEQIHEPAQMELHHITKAEFDHGATRDRLARMSHADLMLFMTQDAVPSSYNLVENLVKAFEDPTIAAAYARQVPYKKHSAIEQFTRRFNYPKQSSVHRMKDIGTMGIKTFMCSNVCAMYRKSVYDELGGFPPQCIFNEDMLLASQAVYAGYGIAYQADAAVYHSHDYSGMEQLRRNFDNGVSQKLNYRYFGSVPAYGEGGKLVAATASYLIKSGRPQEIPHLVWLSACKLVGFMLGKKYYLFPRDMVLRLTMNQSYWDNND